MYVCCNPFSAPTPSVSNRFLEKIYLTHIM